MGDDDVAEEGGAVLDRILATILVDDGALLFIEKDGFAIGPVQRVAFLALECRSQLALL